MRFKIWHLLVIVSVAAYVVHEQPDKVRDIIENHFDGVLWRN